MVEYDIKYDVKYDIKYDMLQSSFVELFSN